VALASTLELVTGTRMWNAFGMWVPPSFGSVFAHVFQQDAGLVLWLYIGDPRIIGILRALWFGSHILYSPACVECGREPHEFGAFNPAQGQFFPRIDADRFVVPWAFQEPRRLVVPPSTRDFELLVWLNRRCRHCTRSWHREYIHEFYASWSLDECVRIGIWLVHSHTCRCDICRTGRRIHFF